MQQFLLTSTKRLNYCNEKFQHLERYSLKMQKCKGVIYNTGRIQLHNLELQKNDRGYDSVFYFL